MGDQESRESGFVAVSQFEKTKPICCKGKMSVKAGITRIYKEISS